MNLICKTTTYLEVQLYTVTEMHAYIFCIHRTYECRCVLPLLNSAVRVVLGDSKVPGVGVLFKVGMHRYMAHPQVSCVQLHSTFFDLCLGCRCPMQTHHCCSSLTNKRRSSSGHKPLRMSSGTDRPLAGNCTCIHIRCLVSTSIRSFTTRSKIAACRIVSFIFLHCRNLQLAFGSLLNTNKAPVHTGDTVENPLLKLGNLDKPPVSTENFDSVHATYW